MWRGKTPRPCLRQARIGIQSRPSRYQHDCRQELPADDQSKRESFERHDLDPLITAPGGLLRGAHSREELIDFELEPIAFCRKRLRRRKNLGGSGAGFARSAVHICNVGHDLRGALGGPVNIERNLYEILQILSVSIFDKTPLNQLLQECPLQIPPTTLSKQLNLLDL